MNSIKCPKCSEVWAVSPGKSNKINCHCGESFLVLDYIGESDSTWKCEQCGKMNWSVENVCRGCNQRRSSESVLEVKKSDVQEHADKEIVEASEEEKEYKVFILNKPNDAQERLTRIVNIHEDATVLRGGILIVSKDSTRLKSKLDTGEFNVGTKIPHEKLISLKYKKNVISVIEQLFKPMLISLFFTIGIIVLANIRGSSLSAEEMVPVGIGSFLFFSAILILSNLGKISFRSLGVVSMHSSAGYELDFSIQDRFIDEILELFAKKEVEVEEIGENSVRKNINRDSYYVHDSLGRTYGPYTRKEIESKEHEDKDSWVVRTEKGENKEGK